MPLTPPPEPPARGRPRSPAGPRRRSMVAGALGALPLGGLTAACSDDRGSARAEAEGRRLRREAARQSRELLARYDATAEAHTQLAERLGPLRAATLRHTEVLDGRRGTGDAKGDPGGQKSRGSAGDDGKHGGPRVPGEAKAALAALCDAERRTAHARTTALVQAPPETARLLASLAAACAAHAYLLGTDDDGPDDGEADDGDGKDGGA